VTASSSPAKGDLAVVPPGLPRAFAAARGSDADLLIVITPVSRDPSISATQPGSSQASSRPGACSKFRPSTTPSTTAQRLACDRAYQMTQERYDQLEEQVDELLASPAYQRASSAAARKKAAERFLITRADGFSPPTSLVREELHGRAQQLAKAARASASGLF
jgi:hypothetical protein